MRCVLCSMDISQGGIKEVSLARNQLPSMPLLPLCFPGQGILRGRRRLQKFQHQKLSWKDYHARQRPRKLASNPVRCILLQPAIATASHLKHHTCQRRLPKQRPTTSWRLPASARFRGTCGKNVTLQAGAVSHPFCATDQRNTM